VAEDDGGNCEALWGKSVTFDVGQYKINWIELNWGVKQTQENVNVDLFTLAYVVTHRWVLHCRDSNSPVCLLQALKVCDGFRRRLVTTSRKWTENSMCRYPATTAIRDRYKRNSHPMISYPYATYSEDHINLQHRTSLSPDLCVHLMHKPIRVQTHGATRQMLFV